MNSFIEKIKNKTHRRRDSCASESSATVSAGGDEQCPLDGERKIPESLSFGTTALVLCDDSPRVISGTDEDHCDLSHSRSQPCAELRRFSNRKSRFSNTLWDVLKDPCELGYFLTFMDAKGFKHLVKFWLETETFRVTARRLGTAACRGDSQPAHHPEADGREALSPTDSPECAASVSLRKAMEQDAVAVFAKYISKEAVHSIGASDELRDGVINRICDASGRQDPDCFSSAQQFVLDIMANRFLADYLSSVVHCKYVLELLRSGRVFITDILYNDVALFHFAEFMEQEGQRNLIEFWLSVDSFQQQLAEAKGAVDGEQAEKDAMVLYDRYFSMQATRPLGFDDQLRVQIENNICGEDGRGPTADCFDKPFRYVMKLMEEKWLARFLGSAWYERYLSELIAAAQMYDLDLPKGGGTSTGSTVSSGEREPARNTLLARDSPAAAARRKQMEAVINDGDNIAIQTASYDPNVLWKRDGVRHGFAHVDQVGRYVREYTQAVQHKRTKSGGEKISEAVRKLVHKDTKEKEALAEEVAALIVRDVTSMTQCS